MTEKSFLNAAFDPCYGETVRISPLVQRLTANNPGPFAGSGTNTYIIGDRNLAIVDPGPDQWEHWMGLRRLIGERRVSTICVSHVHPDHSPLAWRLAEIFDATVVLCDPTPRRRPQAIKPELSAAIEFAARGQELNGDGWRLSVIPTPGHTWGHASFHLREENTLFSGDHVMAWATPAIRPPEGNMDAYFASLDETIAGAYDRLLPAHGPPIDEPFQFLAAYRAHRLRREQQILELIGARSFAPEEIAATLYDNLAPALAPAAADTVRAHLHRLHGLGLAFEEGARWRATKVGSQSQCAYVTSPSPRPNPSVGRTRSGTQGEAYAIDAHSDGRDGNPVGVVRRRGIRGRVPRF